MWTIATEEGKIEFEDGSVWSKEMTHFVSECLKQNPLDRPSSSLLLKVLFYYLLLLLSLNFLKLFLLLFLLHYHLHNDYVNNNNIIF